MRHGTSKKDFVIERGLDIRNKRLKYWEALLLEWTLAVEKYCFLTGGDPGYWYGEEANTSILAASAWKAGFVALQEYQSEKRKGRKLKDGKTDLLIRFIEKNEAIIETKILHHGYSNKTEVMERSMRNLLEEACKNARENKKYEGVVRIGALYCCIKFDEEYKAEIDEKIKETINTCLNTGYDAIAWCYPTITRDFPDEDNKQIVPGITLLVRVAEQ